MIEINLTISSAGAVIHQQMRHHIEVVRPSIVSMSFDTLCQPLKQQKIGIRNAKPLVYAKHPYDEYLSI